MARLSYNIVESTPDGRLTATCKGFAPYTMVIHGESPQDPAGWPPEYRLVLVLFDGEYELFVVDGADGFAALKKLWEDEWGPDRVTYTAFKYASL